MKIRNMTGRAISVRLGDGQSITYPSEGNARIESVTEMDQMLGDVPLWHRRDPLMLNLPDPEPDTFLIVSAVVKLFAAERDDLIVPAHVAADKRYCLGFWH